MAKSIVASVADFTKQIADSVAIGDTTFTLNSLTDADGVALADLGLYGFTIDTGAKKEYVVATLSSGTFTGVKSISRQGAVTTGFTKEHRIGVVAQITDHAALYRVVATLLGVNDLDSGVALKYDGAPAQTAPNALATVQFVLDTANGGAVSFNATTIAGIVGENVTAGDWVYLKESDGKWYLTDADDVAKSVNVKIGKVRATTTSGNSVAGGIFVDGEETVATYVAGTTYYLSNTAGALATSAGTNSVVVGVGDEDGDLVFFKQGLLASTTGAGVVEEATQAEVTAGTAVGATGARLFVNPSSIVPGPTPDVQTFNENGTWTKPTNGGKMARIECWGAGGSGGAVTLASDVQTATGGGGGEYAVKTVLLSSLGATETVTIGAGGTSVAAGNNGVDGGTTSFGTVLYAGGGKKGLYKGSEPDDTLSGGNGGDYFSVGFPSCGIGSVTDATGLYYNAVYANGIYSGAGAPYLDATVRTPGNSVYGGAGGGTAREAVAGAGGVSRYGGAGGAAATGTTATSGTAPGGGGGGATNGSSGAGAAGRVVVTVY